MKTNLHKELTRWGLIVLLASIAVTFTQCMPQQTKSPIAEDEYHSDLQEELPSEPLTIEEARPDIIEEAPDVSVKDYERVLHTMSALTGVPVAGTVLNEYNSRLRAQLPANSRLETLSETNILGMTKLASEFCQELIENGTRRAAVWPAADFNFGLNSSVFWARDSATRRNFITRLLNQFWGQGVLTEIEYTEGRQVIDTLVSEMLESPVDPVLPNNSTTTRNIAKAACTVALSSMHVYLQ